jgi:hypothetical protein
MQRVRYRLPIRTGTLLPTERQCQHINENVMQVLDKTARHSLAFRRQPKYVPKQSGSETTGCHSWRQRREVPTGSAGLVIRSRSAPNCQTRLPIV